MNIIEIITLTAFIIFAIILLVYHFIPDPSQKAKKIISLCSAISIVLFIFNWYHEDILFFYDTKTNNTASMSGIIGEIEECTNLGRIHFGKLYIEIDNSKYYIDEPNYTKSGNSYKLSDFSGIKIRKHDKVTIVYGKSSKRIIEISKIE